MRRVLVAAVALSLALSSFAAADVVCSSGWKVFSPTTSNEWLEVVYDDAVPDSGGWKILPRASGSGTQRALSIRGPSDSSCKINLHANNNIDISGNHVGMPCPLAFDRGGYVFYMNGVALQGYGTPASRASGAFFSASSLQTGIAALASGTSTISPYNTDTAATYRVECWVNIRNAGSSSLTWTVAFTDDRGGAQTFTVPFTNASGTRTTSALTATGYYYGEVLIRSQDYPSGTVTVSEAGTSPTSHDGGAVILQVQGVQ